MARRRIACSPDHTVSLGDTPRREAYEVRCSRNEAGEYLIPRLAIRTLQPEGSVAIIDNLFPLRIPSDLPSHLQREIRQMASGCRLMAAFEIGDRALARLDAIEKIADVKIELLGR